MSDQLNLRLKTLIVKTLKLDDVRPEDIPDDEPLIGPISEEALHSEAEADRGGAALT